MIKAIRNLFKRKFFSGILDLRSLGNRFAYGTSQRYNWSYSEFYNICLETYNSNSDFQEMIEILARGCYSLPIGLQSIKDQAMKDIPEEIKDFLEAPMPDGGNLYDLVLIILISYYVAGEVCFLKDFKKNKVIFIRPDEVTKIDFVEGTPFKFTISPNPYSELKISKKFMYYENYFKAGKEQNQIAYLKHINPISRLRGLGIVPSLFNHVGILKEGPKWNFNLLLNDGKPAGVLHYPDPHKAQMASRGSGASQPGGADSVEEQIQKDFAGSINAGRLLFLRGGLAFTPITLKPKDLDFIAGLKFSREMIANRLGIPLQLVGSEAKQSFNNVREMKEHFQTATTVPLYNRVLKFITEKIIHDFWPEYSDYSICVDEAKTQVSSIKKFEKLKEMAASQIYTLNEMREEMGLKKLKIQNADVPIFKGGMPIDMLGAGMVDEEDDDDNDDDDKEEKTPEKDDKK